MNPEGLLRRVGRCKRAYSRFRKRVWKTLMGRRTITGEDLEECIRILRPCRVGDLLVHSSLGSCGWIVGGPNTVLRAIQHCIAPRNMFLPTHTYCYPMGNSEGPIFDPAYTPSAVGAITEFFWRQPGVFRSCHPSHSLAGLGPDAKLTCDGHELCATPCGDGTPYSRLVQRDCSVLMFGATMESYTLFHTAEDDGQLRYLYETKHYKLQYRTGEGAVGQLCSRRHNMGIMRRFGQLDSWLEQRGILRRASCGLGQLLYIPHSLKLHQVLLKEFQEDPHFLLSKFGRLFAKKITRHDAN